MTLTFERSRLNLAAADTLLLRYSGEASRLTAEVVRSTNPKAVVLSLFTTRH